MRETLSFFLNLFISYKYIHKSKKKTLRLTFSAVRQNLSFSAQKTMSTAIAYPPWCERTERERMFDGVEIVCVYAENARPPPRGEKRQSPQRILQQHFLAHAHTQTQPHGDYTKKQCLKYN